jgi:hypothetical protein
MSGNVGGGGSYDAIKENTQAIKDADKNRAIDSLQIRDFFKNILIQLRILNVHQEAVTGEKINSADITERDIS